MSGVWSLVQVQFPGAVPEDEVELLALLEAQGVEVRATRAADGGGWRAGTAGYMDDGREALVFFGETDLREGEAADLHGVLCARWPGVVLLWRWLEADEWDGTLDPAEEAKEAAEEAEVA